MDGSCREVREPGGRSLVRPAADDMFYIGHREAHAEGRAEGIEAGYAQGYADGFAEGQAEARGDGAAS